MKPQNVDIVMLFGFRVKATPDQTNWKVSFGLVAFAKALAPGP